MCIDTYFVCKFVFCTICSNKFCLATFTCKFYPITSEVGFPWEASGISEMQVFRRIGWIFIPSNSTFEMKCTDFHRACLQSFLARTFSFCMLHISYPSPPRPLNPATSLPPPLPPPISHPSLPLPTSIVAVSSYLRAAPSRRPHTAVRSSVTCWPPAGRTAGLPTSRPRPPLDYRSDTWRPVKWIRRRRRVFLRRSRVSRHKRIEQVDNSTEDSPERVGISN